MNLQLDWRILISFPFMELPFFKLFSVANCLLVKYGLYCRLKDDPVVIVVEYMEALGVFGAKGEDPLIFEILFV